jgi:RHS repeat-associated protein
LTTIDEQRGIETTTSYLQNFPFIGYPASTEVKTDTGLVLSHAENTWLDKTGETQATETYRQPYLSQAIEYTCDLASAGSDCDQGSGALLTTVTTTTTVDAYGNAQSVNVTTVGAGETFGKATSNDFDDDDVGAWKLGRLTDTTVTHSRTGAANVSRSARFDYAAGSKILNQEITEPDGSPSETLTTSYTLDAFGNRQVVQVAGWDGSANVNRTTTLTFDSKGRFANETRNAYNQLTELVVTRNTIGQPTQVKNISQVPTDIRYGDLGQEYFRRDPTGAFVHVEQALCSDVGGCPEAAYYRSRKTVAGGGRSDVYFDVLGREVRTATVGFNGTEVYVDTEYDNVGRVARKSEPYFAGETSYWTEFSYDVLGRITSVRHPDYPDTGNETTSVYDGFVTTITNGKGQQKIETRNAVGELTLVEDALGNTVAYNYDATGNLTTSTQTAADTSGTAVTTLSHDDLGRKTAMTDADMGSWSYAYNAFGELIQQTTAIAERYTTVAYDLLGRMTNRIDFAGGTQESNSQWLYDLCTNGLGQLCQEDTIPGGPPNTATVVRTFSYEQYGRPETTTTTIGSDTYVTATTYDQYGRVFQRFDGAETYSGLEYQYTPDGHLEAAIESRGSASVTVERYRITAKDARGQVTGMSKGGIDVSRTYAADSGRLQSIYAQNQLAVTIQDFAFEWDVLGNLTDKVDSHRALSEQYDYDALNRLTSVSGSSSLSLSYDGLGNIATKSDVGTYSYGSKPHAVTSDGNRTYSYDGNGNLISGTDGRSNSYTVFNKPYAMSRAGSTVTIDYGPNRERYRRLDNQGGQVTVTHYVGSIEKISRPGPVIEIKRYLDGEAIETISGSTRTTQYLFTDHLGSVDVITNASGSVVQSMAFDAFGRRRDAVDYDAFTDPMIVGFDTSKTTRGFTFHEQLDPVGLIHMNGRVYDPTLGRFLSPDPFVQDPSNTQSLNRYSYVFNNPLSYTDPSGYFSARELVGVAVAAIGTYICAGNVQCGYAGWAAVGAASGGAQAAANGGNLNQVVTGAVWGAFSSAAFYGVGNYFQGVAGQAGRENLKTYGFAGMKLTAREIASYVVAHGVVGGTISALQGGSFGHGFFSAGFAKAATGSVDLGDSASAMAGEAVIAAIVGGTASEISGGKFVNGAVTAALAFLFNECAHNKGCWVNSEERQLARSGDWRGFYAKACENGDSYACAAIKVATSDGLLETATNIRLAYYLLEGGTPIDQIALRMESIRVELPKAYVRLLDSLGASELRPMWPTRSGIEQFHEEVFIRHGAAPGGFGGPISDEWIPHIYNYCPHTCAR